MFLSVTDPNDGINNLEKCQENGWISATLGAWMVEEFDIQ